MSGVKKHYGLLFFYGSGNDNILDIPYLSSINSVYVYVHE